MTDLTQRRVALIQWAQSCLTAEDWHGLWDCAVDLAIIDARQQDRTMRLFELDSRDVVQPWGKRDLPPDAGTHG